MRPAATPLAAVVVVSGATLLAVVLARAVVLAVGLSLAGVDGLAARVAVTEHVAVKSVALLAADDVGAAAAPVPPRITLAAVLVVAAAV